jgi:hypothetical protein
MDHVNDFYEDDEPAEVIHQLFDSAPEYGLTSRPLPFGAQPVGVCNTFSLSHTTLRPLTSFKMTVMSGTPTPA